MKRDRVIPCRLSVAVIDVSAEEASCSWMRRDGAVAVVFVTGSAVGSRVHDVSDPIVRRIVGNADLYVSVHGDGTADYVRRSAVNDVIDSLGVPVVGVVVCHDMSVVDVEAEVQAVRRDRFSLTALKSDMGLVEILSSSLLKRILLPVLLFYLVVLLADNFVRSSLTDKLAAVRTARAEETRAAEKLSAVTETQARLFSEYDAVPRIGVARISDAVASAVPERVRLTLLSVNDPKVMKKVGVAGGRSVVVVKGDSFVAEDVMTFAERLGDSVSCETMNVVGLERDRKEDVVHFEIHLVL